MSGREERWGLVPTKEKIVRVAVKLFSKKGFKGTTIKDIAREVGITEGAIYRHFTSKEDIIRHITARITGELTELISGEVFSQKTFKDKVAKLVEILMGYALRNPDSFRYLTVYHILREEGFQNNLPGKRILDMFRTAYTKGDTDLIPEVALAVVIGSVDRMFILRELGLTKATDEEIIEEVKKAVLRAIT